ncbi:MAG: hypothetical protein N3I35_11575 [Clostridia bacterium]|nr:hypothetical protein [Clostridia bacterium]
MIITLTAPKKGLGQTITAINLAALSELTLGEKVMLIDINKYCRDIEYFLSNTEITKGLDEFICLYNTGMLNSETFNTCVKNVKGGLHIMASNDCLELNGDVVESLVRYTSDLYKTTIIDSISGNNNNSDLFFKHSDVVIVILNQSKNVINMAANNIVYRKYTSKIVFVLNKNMTVYANKKIQYTLQDVEADLKENGFNCPVFPLEYSAEVLNEYNDHSVLNLIQNDSTGVDTYRKQIDAIIRHIAGYDIKPLPQKKVFKSTNNKKARLFNFI